MAVKNEHIRSVYTLSILTSILIAVFAATTFVQIKWTNDLQEKHADTRREIEQLKKKCLEKIIHSIYSSEAQGPGGDARRRRQVGSLQQMMQEMMDAQEKILLSHCLNNTGLCVKGQKGSQGLTGDPGLPASIGNQGIKGVTGPKGDKGLAGSPGIKGFKGTTGLQGHVGTSGQKGLRGRKGSKGAIGNIGAVGKQGPRGPTGEKGDRGNIGPIGSPGKVGPQGLLRGVKGEKGSDGVDGDPGTIGAQGVPGVDLQKDCQCTKKSDIDIFSKPDTYYIGQNVSLVCDSTSDPKPLVVWYGPKGPCGQQKVHSPTLHINSLQPSQTGSYTCVANSVLGTFNKTVNVQITDTNYMDCDFENRTLCNWKNSDTDAYSWNINNGSTPHSNTGPNVDHTLGTNGGHYLYVRGRTFSKDRATDLISPKLGAGTDGCLTFWYHMQGHVGKLEVLKEQTQCNGSKSTILFAKISRNSTQWHFASVNIVGSQLDHRLLIRSIQSGSIDNDIAIDDIHYYDGSCKATLIRSGPATENVTVTAGNTLQLHCGIEGYPNVTYEWRKVDGCAIHFNGTGETITISDGASSGYTGTYECTARDVSGSHSSLTQTINVLVNGTSDTTCDFQHGFCGWSQVKSDIFDWSLASGPTQSLETGPTNDHTLGNLAGKYAYIEASLPQQDGSYAVLKSPLLHANKSVCFSFYYNMYGVDTGNLIVKAEDACTQKTQVLFSTSGEKGEHWFHESIDIPTSMIPENYHITIKATVGKTFHGDTAIDDLRINEGNCSGTSLNILNCTFDKDLCNWSQSKTDNFDWSNDFGETPSTGTGPEHDHTNPNGRGHYLYTEASSKGRHEYADLVSPELPAGQAICLQMFTNMRGSKMGDIKIMTEDDKGVLVPVKTLHNADTVSIWRPQSITIPAPSTNYHVIIRGIIGDSYTSDAAIDDITASKGQC